jgi:hypothetical protein
MRRLLRYKNNPAPTVGKARKLQRKVKRQRLRVKSSNTERFSRFFNGFKQTFILVFGRYF